MANAKDLCKGRLIRISYRRATFVVCAGNLVVMLCMMYLILSPLYLRTSSLPDLVMAVAPLSHNGRYSEQRYTKEDLELMKSCYKLRRALIPFHLIEEVKELQAETEADIKRTKKLSAARQKVSTEVSQRLAQVKQTSNTQSNQQGLQNWKKKKLQGARRREGQQQNGVSKWKMLGGANK